MILEHDAPAVAQLAITLAGGALPNPDQLQAAADLLEETRGLIADRVNQATALAVAAEIAKASVAGDPIEGDPVPLPPLELKQ